MLQVNADKIEALKQNAFFIHPFTNLVGLELVKYLTKTKYYQLMNREPVDLNKNTLSKELNYLKVIDAYINKPVNEYEFEDVEKFIMAFRNGEVNKQKTYVRRTTNGINVETKATDKPRTLNMLRRYVGAFKRFWRVYRMYALHNLPDYDAAATEWGLNVVSPKHKYEYEDYPVYSINQLTQFAETLCKPEYTARVLLSINLMARKCELSQLQYKHIDFRENGEVWVTLPNVKKHSSNKVPVELYEYCIARLKSYLALKRFEPNDLLFPTKEPAFAKELRVKSKQFFNDAKQITPKTLRKLGVCVANELGIPRTQVEDIGGWSRNSPVLEHYFSRRGVARNEVANAKINKTEHTDVYAEIDKLKARLEERDEFITNYIREQRAKETINTNEQLKNLIAAMKPS